MSVRAAQIIFDAEGFVIDRAQSAGVTTVNVPLETVREVGNESIVAQVRDIPDLSFGMESLDVSTELVAILTGVDPTTVTAHQVFNLDNSVPIDIISPFKTGLTNYAVIKGVATPYLTLENVTYRFGVKANATQQYTLRGDSIFYIPGSPYTQKFNLVAGLSQVYTLAHTAIAYTYGTGTYYALSVCVRNPTTHVFKRLHLADDYTNSSTTVTVLADQVNAGYTELHVTYGSTAAATYGTNVHQGVSVKPAAVRGKDIDIYLSDGAATPTLVRMRGVQSFEATRRVTLDNDEEFGSIFYVSQDYDTADVNGNIVVKPADAAALWSIINNVTSTATNVVAGAQSSAPLAMEARISSPDTGAVLKTLYVPDARFTPPGIDARVNTKLTTTFPWVSDTGSLSVINGTRS